jgi:hypothetical protein
MRNFHIGTITGIPTRVTVTLLLFLPVLAWLISGGEQLTAYAGVIASLSAQTVDVGTDRTGPVGLRIVLRRLRPQL